MRSSTSSKCSTSLRPHMQQRVRAAGHRHRRGDLRMVAHHLREPPRRGRAVAVHLDVRLGPPAQRGRPHGGGEPGDHVVLPHPVHPPLHRGGRTARPPHRSPRSSPWRSPSARRRSCGRGRRRARPCWSLGLPIPSGPPASVSVAGALTVAPTPRPDRRRTTASAAALCRSRGMAPPAWTRVEGERVRAKSPSSVEGLAGGAVAGWCVRCRLDATQPRPAGTTFRPRLGRSGDEGGAVPVRGRSRCHRRSVPLTTAVIGSQSRRTSSQRRRGGGGLGGRCRGSRGGDPAALPTAMSPVAAPVRGAIGAYGRRRAPAAVRPAPQGRTSARWPCPYAIRTARTAAGLGEPEPVGPACRPCP